jgi:hypothetical protein
MDWVTLVIALAAIAFIVWTLYRNSAREATDDVAPSIDTAEPSLSRGDVLEYLAPKPITPPFHVDDWDGYSGLQSALSVGMSENQCYPIIEAGTVPPVSVTQTLSTSYPDQDTIEVRLYAGLSEEIDKSELMQAIGIGPIRVTGAAIREIDATFSVDEQGRVTVSAVNGDGEQIGVTVRKEMLGAIVVGPSNR